MSAPYALQNAPSLAEFGRNMVEKLAVPEIARGYSELVQQLKEASTLAKLIGEQGIDGVLSSDNAEISHLRKGNRELVTEAEKEAERLMTEAVKKQFPDHAIIGEELGFTEGGNIRWVFDPVDGTSAMIKTAISEAFGLSLEHPAPSFGITAAVVEGEEAIIGIVTELKPQAGKLVAGRTWTGEKGKPALCNGKPIKLPTVPAMKDAVITSTVPQVMFGTSERWGGYQALMEATKASIAGQNCIGFMQLLHESGIHIAYEADLAYHDAAALVPILEGAGITITEQDGERLLFPPSAFKKEFTLLAAQPSLHTQALALIRKGVPQEHNSFARRNVLNSGYANKFPA